MQAGDGVVSQTVLDQVGRVRALLPAAWGSVVDAAVLPVSRWSVSSCSTWVCRAQERFSVLPDGRLGPLDSLPAPASWEAVLWSPAVVAWCRL